MPVIEISEEDTKSLSLVALDNLCLKAIDKFFRCDDDWDHSGSCSHMHRSQIFCDWHEVWGPSFVERHRGNA